jgi:predicted nucleic acid-binding protein
MYLLDTNHCSYLLEKHPAITQKLVDLGETPVATCVIVRGKVENWMTGWRFIDNEPLVQQ